MSRSIHTKRKDIDDIRKWEYADPDVHNTEARKLRADIRRKRRVKRQVKGQRCADDAIVVSAEVEAVPITVLDTGQFVHYPASPDDIKNIMSLLPGGSLDKLSKIELCLGLEYLNDSTVFKFESGDEPDPLTGRIGHEMIPGIFTGHILGYYSRTTSSITLFAYVYDTETADVQLFEVYLRLQMLSTVVHEIAHSVDLTTRLARDRWLGDDTSKVEMYAEKLQYSWMIDYVVPYLESRYPEQVKALLDWIEHYGGIRLELALLAGECRSTRRNGLVALGFDACAALHNLIEEVAEGKSLKDTRMGFAWSLHYAELNEEVLHILDGLLNDCADDVEALSFKAHVYYDLEENEKCCEYARKAIALDPNFEDAWTNLCYSLFEQEAWKDVIQTATHILDSFDLRQNIRRFMLIHRAEARLNTADIPGMKADLELAAQETNKPYTKRPVDNVQLLYEIQYDLDGTKRMAEAFESSVISVPDLVQTALSKLPYREESYWNAVKCLWCCGSKEVFTIAKNLCSSESSHERQLGVDILGQLGVNSRIYAGESVPILLRMLQKQGLTLREQDTRVLFSIAVALGHIGDKRALTTLSRMTEYISDAVRYGVAFSLSTFSSKQVIKPLIELSSDTSAVVRRQATLGLAQLNIDNPAIHQALLERANDTDEQTHAHALNALAAKS